MIKMVLFCVFLIASFLLLYLLHLPIMALRYRLGERYLHNRYICALVVAVFVLCNRLSYPYLLLGSEHLINLPQMQGLWGVILPLRRFELLYFLLNYLLTNMMVLSGAGLLLLIIRILFFRHREYLDVSSEVIGRKLLHLPWYLTSFFYKENEEAEDEYHVTDHGFTISLWARRMKYIFLLLGILEVVAMTVSVFSVPESVPFLLPVVEGFYMLPVVGYLLFEQIQYFLETDINYDGGSYVTERIEDSLDGSLRTLMEVYECEFADHDALLYRGGWENYALFQDGLIHNSLTNTQIQDCKQPEILQTIIYQLRQAGVTLNADYQNMLGALLNGESVNVRDYIQGEVLIYLAAYMNFYIAQEKTFMILCDSQRHAEEVRVLLVQKLSKLNRIDSIWNIGDTHAADSNEEMDALICSYQDFVNHRLPDKRRDFFDDLQMVIMTDGEEFTTQGNVQKNLIFAEVRKIRSQLQFALVTRIDNDSMRNAFEYYTHHELVPFQHDLLPKNLYMKIWKEESYFCMQRALDIGQDGSAYMGVALPLALTGVKYDFPMVEVIAERSTAIYTYQDVMKMHGRQISAYLKSEIDLTSRIHINRSDEEHQQSLTMQIIYDTEYNIYNALISQMKYGGSKGTLIHVISPSYILREYMAARLERKESSSHDFDAMISYQSGIHYTRYLELLLELSNAGMTEEELMKKNMEYGWGHANVTELLSEALLKVFSEAEYNNVYECFRFEERAAYDIAEGDFVNKTVVTLTDENIRKRIQTRLQFVRLRTRGNQEEELPILCGNIDNYYMRGQYVPINGYMYHIDSVKGDMMFVNQVTADNRYQYYRASQVVFSNFKIIDRCLDFAELDFNLAVADVSLYPQGYWRSTKGIDFVSEGVMKFEIESEHRTREIKRQNIPILQIRMKKTELGPTPEKVGRLAAFMFQEMIKTLFPYSYMNLYVVSEIPEDCEAFWTSLYTDSNKLTLEEKVRSILPFVRVENEDTDYINLYFVEFSCLELGMIQALYQERERLFGMSRDYLDWYLGESSREGDSSDRRKMGEQVIPSYLNLGGEHIAECFDAEAFLQFCKCVKRASESEKEHEQDMKESDVADHVQRCSFCGRQSLFTWKMSDDRRMCRGCKETQMSQKTEITELYRQTFAALEKGYHIRLRQNIHLKMQSAKSIRQEASKGRSTPVTGRVLGFYRPAKHELWIESGGPRNAVQITMIHELSHAWQFDNMRVERLYRIDESLALILLEGHTSYMEVDAMRRLGEESYARYLHESLIAREDEYGIGYRLLRDYILKKGEERSQSPYEVVKYLFDHLEELQQLIANYNTTERK